MLSAVANYKSSLLTSEAGAEKQGAAQTAHTGNKREQLRISSRKRIKRHIEKVAAAMALPKKAAELKQYLRNANLPEEFARHCLRTLQMGSLEDFVSYVSSSNYEAELKTRVVDTCAATKGPKSSRIAWMESAELSELSKDSEVVDCDIGSLIAQLQNYVFRRRVRIKEMPRCPLSKPCIKFLQTALGQQQEQEHLYQRWKKKGKKQRWQWPQRA
ncbi:hypothetical protein AK812_SmicGene42023 [Symbiodinium microadriaticum]|uniref:Uncharacterized protein n=1 Tax=Symbiodinium microadriaticum TaxID=2951 RepID=A0A1Q9C4M6_SYMMI|nr:hypothetical protein AK812_SmicGene42023 [Symbiodinium microadriaticum]